MAILQYDALLRGLSEGRRGGVFFVYGAERFLKEQALEKIIAAHLDPATRDFNLDRLDGENVESATLASLVQTPPMMAEWRVVAVREAQGLAGSSRLRGAVDRVLAEPPPGLALVLVAEIPERSKAKFYKRLKRDAVAVECARLDTGDVPAWLVARAEAEGLELDPAAARALAAAIGPDLGPLVRELDKLREFVDEGARVGVDEVERVVGPIQRQNRWDWMDLVGGAEFAEARAALPVLLEASESGVGLVIGLGTHFLRLAILAADGKRALADALPRHLQWLPRRLTPQASKWTPEALDGALDDLLRADRLLKSTSLDDRQIMEELLLRLQARARDPAVV